MKKIAKAIVSMGVVLAFAGCSWQIPQTVSVKTNADYSFSLGNFTNDLGDSMDTTSMMGDAGEGNANIQTLDYFPGKIDKNTQHYLLEVMVLDRELVDATTVNNSSTDTINIPNSTVGPKNVGLDFNPSSILDSMKDALGGDLDGKIEFDKVPIYLYCETVPGLTADATLSLFYGNKPSNSATEPTQIVGSVTKQLLTANTIQNTPKPKYEKEGNVIISNLASSVSLAGQEIDIKDFINSDTIEEDHQLCISYTLENVGGTINKTDAPEGVKLKLYAVIDLPVRFKVKSDVSLDVSKMSGESDSSSSSSSSSESSSSSGDSEFSKYLNVMDSVSIKYVVYQLPIYAANGMQLWVDLLGDGANYDKGSDIVFVDKNKTITDADKSSITLKTATIQRMKANANFNPNFVLFLRRNSVFSLPREKKIDMNLEMGFETDGTIQVK